MQSMKARYDEETRTELRHTPWITERAGTFKDEVRPLVRLATQEDDSSTDRCGKKSNRMRFVLIAGRGHSHRHQGTAADQCESHECDQPHVEDLRLNRPFRAEQTHESIPAQ